YSARVRLAPEFSSPEIEKLSSVALQSGADAVKICGAGGGGCVLLWVKPQNQESVAQACQKNGFQVLKAKPVGPL
ncbi:MAG: galactokinase, partial [Pseudobdellovibrionaceae bacterium]